MLMLNRNALREYLKWVPSFQAEIDKHLIRLVKSKSHRLHNNRNGMGWRHTDASDIERLIGQDRSILMLMPAT